MHRTANAPAVPPPLAFGLTEGLRAASEYGWFLASRRWLARGRSGAGRPVLVVPGLDAADRSTKPLRNLLSSVGYHAYGWGLGRNVGPAERIITGLDELLLQIRDRHQAPVSVIGQSLGGLLGRELARRHPGAVGRLITLGSQVTMTSLRQSRAWPGLPPARRPAPSAVRLRALDEGAATADPVHVDLQPQRRHRAVGDLPLSRGAAHREHRGLRQPPWTRCAPGRGVRRTRPTGGRGRRLGQVHAAGKPARVLPGLLPRGGVTRMIATGRRGEST